MDDCIPRTEASFFNIVIIALSLRFSATHLGRYRRYLQLIKIQIPTHLFIDIVLDFTRINILFSSINVF